ncbi:Protein MNN4 [Tolypocladium capitatum]|uniref:Protein MNN4 n=1 Tax=Tolypocladium capitatum TaxID=45235 RepID=A0A2K3QGP5_9HYPO|nr:Protein MNN4 [Tolypocladium capitatum]
MPWDFDADVQVTEADMYYLAAYYNMTVYYYKYGSMTKGRYFLLDINPHFTYRERDDLLNFIDARWVDMESGLFIDITAARYDPNHEAGEGMLYDKNEHEYRVSGDSGVLPRAMRRSTDGRQDTYVFPLRDTTFEGVPAKIPFRYKEMLESEYGKSALTNRQFHGICVVKCAVIDWAYRGGLGELYKVSCPTTSAQLPNPARVCQSTRRNANSLPPVRIPAVESAYDAASLRVALPPNMATAGRERRAERLNERLRGAQRTNVGDDSFSLNIEGFELPAHPTSPARRTPSTAAKKRKRGDSATSAASQEKGSTGPRSTRSAPRDPYDLPDTSKESVEQLATAKDLSSSRVGRSSSRAGSVATRQGDQEADELDILPGPVSTQSPARWRMSGAVLEEVEESPAHAPGSGRRRNLPMSATLSSATRLQSALGTDDTAPSSSSPLVRRARRSDAAASVRSRRSFSIKSRVSMSEDADELSPGAPRVQAAEERDMSDTHPIDEEPEREEAVEPEEQAEPSEEEAEEIDAAEAARTLGRKRPRRSMRTGSPELGSGAPAEEQEDEEDEEPAPKRKGGSPSKSSAVQKRPARKPKLNPQKQPSQATRTRRQSSKAEKPTTRRRRESGDGGDDDDDDDDVIEITVQRFVNNKRRDADADGSDPLHAEIPFANRGGETVVDVFAQVCEEVVAATLAQLAQLADAAEDAAKRKECRIKMRAVEAYGEELRSRLLQHAIHLNHWYSLRKQVRQAQKEKLSLRDEILRLRAEREQVALRMDAVRIKHEADSKEATYRINMSTLMHDLDLAVEQGIEAPELSRAAQKQADLANLELLIARVSDQASSASSTGGMLRQVADFNAFLERAALALESR